MDYEKILREAEEGPGVEMWNGGNNHIPNYKPGLHIANAQRPGHEMMYDPGKVDSRDAGVLHLSKRDSNRKENIGTVVRNAKALNPGEPSSGPSWSLPSTPLPPTSS